MNDVLRVAKVVFRRRVQMIKNGVIWLLVIIFVDDIVLIAKNA